jgi:hypothetical protein
MRHQHCTSDQQRVEQYCQRVNSARPSRNFLQRRANPVFSAGYLAVGLGKSDFFTGFPPLLLRLRPSCFTREPFPMHKTVLAFLCLRKY